MISELRLLPPPRQLSPLEGSYTINQDTALFVPAQAGDEVLFAAGQLQGEICEAICLKPVIIKAFTPFRADNAVFLLCGQEQARSWGLQPPEIAAPPLVASQAYVLTVAPERVVLYADTSVGLFYAVQTLRQLVRLHAPHLPALEIRDWPALPYRGLMLDISRRKVPELDTLMHLVEELSHYKLNVLQLYTEHTFHFPRHPRIGAGCGSLTSQDIMELDAYCRRHHVELMPNLQSFGHARNTLLIPEYRHLAETELLWTLSPAFEETYRLLDDLYADFLPSFSSTTFNVDCDETWDLGQGASREMAEHIGVGRVYLHHILRVRELAARYGRRIQIWGDILLHHPELIGELPEDVTLLDWHYDPADEYPSVRTFAQAGRRFWVCPGVGSWNSLFPRLYGANVNIRNLVRDGVSAGAEGMLNTDWGDFGHYQYLGLSWYGYVFGATQGWSGGTTGDEMFNAAFGPLFFGPHHEEIMSALHCLARTNELPGVYRPNISLTALALFDEPLAGSTVEGEDALPEETVVQMRVLAEEAVEILDKLAPGHPRELTLRELASTARLTAYAARKTALSQEIRRALRDPNLSADRLDGCILALRGLDMELEELRAEFEALWLARARRSEIHVALGYYAGLRTRYQAAIRWLERQRQALLKGEAVDAELQTYQVGDYRTLWQTWPD
ncbi:MAG: family 20 glycosylhydrolase [Anaerolineae bacterium]|nr:family 20 glycosylhydrolase [Anaerolineae bacterium]